MTDKEDLEDKIHELEEKLKRLDGFKRDKDIHDTVMLGTSPIGIDANDTLNEISKAKSESTQRAGLVKNSTEGSVWEGDETVIQKIPNTSIHDFDTVDFCSCNCHPQKYDCMKCYDHPVHLDEKRNRTAKPTDEYNEEKIMELIEQDKARQSKKHWWQK